MIRKVFYIFLIILPLNVFAQPDSLNQYIQKANELYKKTKYTQAIELYNKVLKTGWVSPYLYYNLGNAYFRTGNLAKAIVNYERAYRLAPNDPNIKHNLEFARQFVQDKFTTVKEFFLKRWWLDLSLTLKADTWAFTSIALFILTLVFALMYLFAKAISRRKLGFYLAIVFFILSVVTFDLSLVNKHYVLNSGEAIVLKPSSVRSSPSTDGTELFLLHQGVKVKVLNKNDGWYEVKLPNGAVGWMPKNSVEKI